MTDLNSTDTEASLLVEIESARQEMMRIERMHQDAKTRQRDAAIRLRALLCAKSDANAEIHGRDRKLVVIRPDGSCLFIDVEYQGGDF